MKHCDESIFEVLALEVRGLKDSIEKLTDRISEVSGLWQPSGAGYAVQPDLFRVKEGTTDKPDKISCPKDIWNLCKDMERLEQEEMRLILVNTQNQILSVETLYIGTVNTTVISPQDIFRRAVRKNAVGVILVHNHPTGDPEPSTADITATKRVKEAGEIMEIRLLDHVIIGSKGRFTSLKKEGVI